MRSKGFWILSAVIALLLLTVVILPFLFDANRYRPEIESRISQSLGRQVKIGDLNLSLLSGGIHAEKISIADDQAFSRQPFIVAQSLDVGVQMMPLLLHRQILIESLTLNSPVVRLLQSPDGRWNFSSLGSKQTAAKSPESTNDLNVQKLKIADGRIEVGWPRTRTHNYTNVELTASNVSYSSAFPYEFSADAPGNGKIDVKGTAGPLNRQDASLTPLTGDITVHNLDLASTGFMGADSALAGSLDFKGKLISNGRTLTSDGTAKASGLRLVKNGSPASQPVEMDYHSEYDLVREQGAIARTNIRTGKSVAHLGGNYATRSGKTAVELRFTGDKLQVEDIKGLLPALGVILPSGSSLQGGTVNADLNLRGPVDQLITTGDVSLNNARLAGFSLGKGLSSIAALAGAPVHSDTTIQTFSSDVRISPQGTRADNLNLVVPEFGTITGKGTIATDGAIDFHLVAKLASGGSGVMGALTQIAGAKTGLKSIPIAVKGTTAKPVFLPDIGSAVADSVSPGVSGNANPVGDILGGLFGKKKK